MLTPDLFYILSILSCGFIISATKIVFYIPIAVCIAFNVISIIIYSAGLVVEEVETSYALLLTGSIMAFISCLAILIIIGVNLRIINNKLDYVYRIVLRKSSSY